MFQSAHPVPHVGDHYEASLSKHFLAKVHVLPNFKFLLNIPLLLLLFRKKYKNVCGILMRAALSEEESWPFLLPKMKDPSPSSAGYSDRGH